MPIVWDGVCKSLYLTLERYYCFEFHIVTVLTNDANNSKPRPAAHCRVLSLDKFGSNVSVQLPVSWNDSFITISPGRASILRSERRRFESLASCLHPNFLGSESSACWSWAGLPRRQDNIITNEHKWPKPIPSWLCRWEVNYQQTEVRRVDECNVGHVVVEFERPSKSTCRSLTSLGAWSGTWDSSPIHSKWILFKAIF